MMPAGPPPAIQQRVVTWLMRRRYCCASIALPAGRQEENPGSPGFSGATIVFRSPKRNRLLRLEDDLRTLRQRDVCLLIRGVERAGYRADRAAGVRLEDGLADPVADEHAGQR